MTSYFKVFILNFHIKKTILEKKCYLALKAIFIEEKWSKLLKFDPERAKLVILFPHYSKTDSCEVTNINISEFDIQ